MMYGRSRPSSFTAHEARPPLARLVSLHSLAGPRALRMPPMPESRVFVVGAQVSWVR